MSNRSTRYGYEANSVLGKMCGWERHKKYVRENVKQQEDIIGYS